jgi:hypothetical protein
MEMTDHDAVLKLAVFEVGILVRAHPVYCVELPVHPTDDDLPIGHEHPDELTLAHLVGHYWPGAHPV